MINVSSAQLYAWLGAFLWPFIRILALILSEPVLGNRSVPVRIRVGLAFFLTLLLAPTLAPMPQIDPGSAAGLLIMAQQIMIGVSMGFAMRIVLSGVEMAGHIGGMQRGLGFAVFFDPQNSAQTPVMGQFTGLLAILVFLSISGHLMIISMLAESFHVFPISTQIVSALGWQALVSRGGDIFMIGVLLSLPMVAALLIANLAIGIMTRAAPQLNIFAVGFPLTIAVGLLVLMMSLPYFMPLLERFFQEGVLSALNVVRLSAGAIR